ncbi:cytochrome b [Sphingomonas sp. IC-11]|uniref:cytochrome b n=1 Tax=Sphingomonas sp. IC-11 TaxID=2898528 RepID=UPI001E31AC77|nr:cytochrome b [Sphingomonas sp. IC-11]
MTDIVAAAIAQVSGRHHARENAMARWHGVQRYNNVAIALHWIIAALLLTQIYVGWTFEDMPRGPSQGMWFTWHKTLGMLILLLSVARLAWRFMNPPPPLPAELPQWERTVARINHTLFYVVMIGLPLTGWAAISTVRAAATSSATTMLGSIPLPFIPGLPLSSHDAFEFGHGALIKLTYALIILHVGAALQHQFVDKRATAGRMPPFGTGRR